MIRHWLENHQFELRLLHWMQRDLLVADQTARRMAEVARPALAFKYIVLLPEAAKFGTAFGELGHQPLQRRFFKAGAAIGPKFCGNAACAFIACFRQRCDGSLARIS